MGFWTVDASWTPVDYTAVYGAVPGWIARSMQGDNVLLQTTDGSWTIIWHLNPATGAAESYSSIYNRGSAWPYIARDLEGDKILLQNGDGGASGFWTVDGSWTPVDYTPIYGALPGWRVVAID